MPLITALAILAIVPTIVALVQEGKDRAISSSGGLLIIAAALIGLQPYWRGLANNMHGIIETLVTAVIAVLGLVLAVKLSNRVTGSVIATAAGLLLLIRLDAIQV